MRQRKSKVDKTWKNINEREICDNNIGDGAWKREKAVQPLAKATCSPDL